jgi:hypothetical protein
MLALAETAPHDAREALKDFIWKYLSLKTSICVKVSVGLFTSLFERAV